MADFYSGTSNGARLHLVVNVASQNIAGNYSTISVQLYLERVSGTGRWSGYTDNSWSVNCAGQGANGGGSYDLRPTGSQLLINQSFNVGHASNGTLTFTTSGAFHDPRGNIGDLSVSGNVTAPTIPRAPSAPTLVSLTSVTPLGFAANFNPPSSQGGSAISSYTLQVATNAAFTTGVQNFTGSSSPIAANSLTPSTMYYARVRATNSQGNSPWSNVISVNTSASGAPHLNVIRDCLGRGFWVVLSNPFSVGSVTSFTITRVVSGPNAPAVVNQTVTDPYWFDALVLAPGQKVTYRATALVSSVQTGSSNSVTFDYLAITLSAPWFPLMVGGLTPPGPYSSTQSLVWEGTANNSITDLLGRQPKGWRTFSQGADGLATGVVTQIDESLAPGMAGTGDFEVMAVFGSVQSAAGVRVGTAVSPTEDMTVVYPSINYFGRITAMTDVGTLLTAELEWYTSSGVLLSRVAGEQVQTTAWTPVSLTVSGAAPDEAAYAAVVVTDVDGTGWSAGSLRFAGSAMITATVQYPYFDGDTPDTTTSAYEWMGDQWASPSLRTDSSRGTALVDPDAPPIPAPPLPPAVDDNDIDDDVVWRRYVIKIPALDVRQWIAAVPTLSLFTSQTEERQVRLRYWPNPGDTPVDLWSDAGQTYESEQIISYIPPQATFVIDGVAERAYVNFPATINAPASRAAADHLLFGSGGGPATWPVLACGVSYILTLDVPVDATEDNLDVYLELTDRMMA